MLAEIRHCCSQHASINREQFMHCQPILAAVYRHDRIEPSRALQGGERHQRRNDRRSQIGYEIGLQDDEIGTRDRLNGVGVSDDIKLAGHQLSARYRSRLASSPCRSTNALIEANAS